MGTSSAFRGPTGRRPLLPSWPEVPPDGDLSPAPGAPEPADPAAPRPETPAPVPTETWDRAKRSFSSFVGAGGSRGRGGRRYLRQAGRRFVGAAGGSRTAARGARAGRQTAGRLGAFLATAATAGLAAAVRQLGIEDYVGRDVWSFLSDLVDVLAPDGATLDEAIARRALTETLSEMYGDEAAADAAGGLARLSPEGIGVAVEHFVARYVYTQLIEVLGSRLYDSSRSPQEIRRLEQDVRDYVFQTVRLSVRDVDLRTVDLGGDDGRRLIEDAFAEGYDYLERL